MKGTNGEGARRGRKGWGEPLGEISGRIASIFLTIKTGPFRWSNRLQQDSWKPKPNAWESEDINLINWNIVTENHTCRVSSGVLQNTSYKDLNC